METAKDLWQHNPNEMSSDAMPFVTTLLQLPAFQEHDDEREVDSADLMSLSERVVCPTPQQLAQFLLQLLEQPDETEHAQQRHV
jgi:hypothetical protein